MRRATDLRGCVVRIVTEITEEQIGNRPVFTWTVYDADEMLAADGSRLLYGRGIAQTMEEAEALAAAREAEVPARAAARKERA